MPYALIGGVAMAFYSAPRFTKDIDIIVKKGDLKNVCNILGRKGYMKSAQPWIFKETKLTLHRFLKVADEDEMLIDVLVAGNARIEKMIDHAEVAESKGTGQIRVIRRKDLIWLKKARNSKLDQADVEAIQHE